MKIVEDTKTIYVVRDDEGHTRDIYNTIEEAQNRVVHEKLYEFFSEGIGQMTVDSHSCIDYGEFIKHKDTLIEILTMFDKDKPDAPVPPAPASHVTPPESYRLLERGETIEMGDKRFDGFVKCWIPVNIDVGRKVGTPPVSDTYCRRKVASYTEFEQTCLEGIASGLNIDPEKLEEPLFITCAHCYRMIDKDKVRCPHCKAWPQYRQLQAGEFVQEGDETLDDKTNEWVQVDTCIGREVVDPKYTSHAWYRRKIAGDKS